MTTLPMARPKPNSVASNVQTEKITSGSVPGEKVLRKFYLDLGYESSSIVMYALVPVP